MKQISGYMVATLTVINLLLLLFLVWPAAQPAKNLAGANAFGGKTLTKSAKFTIYVGLNDKDAKQQLIGIAEARDRLNAVAAGHANGFTVRNARGYWTNPRGETEHEQTLIYDFLDATEGQMSELVEQMKIAMNQSVILVEISEPAHVFY